MLTTQRQVISPELREMCDSRFVKLCSSKGVIFQVAPYHRPIHVSVFYDGQQIARETSKKDSQMLAIREITGRLVPFLEKLPIKDKKNLN